MSKKIKNKNTSRIENRKATYLYTLAEKYVAGLQLTGSEVKSIREGKAAIAGSYVTVRAGEVFLVGANVSKWGSGFRDHEELRDRKLLLNKKEIVEIEEKLQSRGVTAVPISIFFNDKGKVKMEFRIATGKRTPDKRQALKEKDLERERRRQ